MVDDLSAQPKSPFINRGLEGRRSPLVPIAFLIVAGLALLTASLLIVRENYLTRGIPEDLPGPILHGGPRLGINVHLEQYTGPQLGDTLLEIEAAGFEAVKQSFYFDEQFDWSVSDRIMDTIAERDIDLVPLLDGNPRDGFAPPEDPTAFANWAGSFARRYGSQLEHYIIWDEPNLASHWGGEPVNPSEYAALLTLTAAAIRAADPEATIVAAPLAPTVETGPDNLADHLYLQSLYEVGASGSFDVAAGKPYGFDSGPYDRTVSPDSLNFSRIILLREVLERNNDNQKAIWAGNWGWNSLPEDWQGEPSIWGQVDEETQTEWTLEGLRRSREEWPWMGLMFLENWQPAANDTGPRLGFRVAGRDIQDVLRTGKIDSNIAYPGFRLARPDDPTQDFDGDWRFSSEFGADVGGDGDTASFRFWGTEVGISVRRADHNARFYVSVDGQPANALPNDGNGAALVLNSPVPAEEGLVTELVAEGLLPGVHTLSLTTRRGSDQWALNGFAAAFRPPSNTRTLALVTLIAVALASFLIAMLVGRQVNWGFHGKMVSTLFSRLDSRRQIALTAFAAGLVALTSWLTWGEQAAGLFRRLGDGGQLAVTTAVAAVFYVAPSFFAYVTALILLFILVYLRPAWGLALVAFSLPFFVKPKPLLSYHFSPVEIFLLVTLAAFVLRQLIQRSHRRSANEATQKWSARLIRPDLAVISLVVVATVSLFFTERLDVASNEWRVVIIEPALFYFMVRRMRLDRTEMWTILDAFVAGGLVVAIIGLWQYGTGQNLITAEGGLMRLRSVYGSPNNVPLYLGRILPLVVAMLLLGKGRRQRAYSAVLVPMAVAMMLTYSKGALLLALPASLLVVYLMWLHYSGRRLWPWLVGAGAFFAAVLLIALQIPQLAGRLSVQGATGFFRVNLWRSSLNMFRDNPVFGVGLDNFLYEYRGRYILDAAWQEPNLSHPHNLFLDFATRLGILGVLSGIWLYWEYWRTAWKLPGRVTAEWRPIAVGLVGSFVYVVAHGIVDHSHFLVDLAFAFHLLLATAVWLHQHATGGELTAP